MGVGGYVRRVQGWTHVKRCNQLAVFTIQPAGGDAAVVWGVEDSVHQGHLFRAPILYPSEGGGKPGRASQRTQAYRDTLYRVSEGGGQPDHRRARGVLNLCARESKARTRSFLRGKLIFDHGLFSSYDCKQGAADGQDS